MSTSNSMWNQQQTAGNNTLFNRNANMPSNLFSGSSGSGTAFSTNTTGNPFQGTNSMMAPSTNSVMGSFNNPLNSNSNMSNNLFNSTARHNYNTRGSSSIMSSTSLTMTNRKGTVSLKYMPKKNNDGFLVQAVTYMPEYKEKVNTFNPNSI